MSDSDDRGPRDAGQPPPICNRCGLATTDLQTSFVNPTTGRTVRIYKCACGKLVWDPPHKAD